MALKLRPVTVHLPEAYIEALDLLVRRRLYPNRAEAIRMAVRDPIISELAFMPEPVAITKEVRLDAQD